MKKSIYLGLLLSVALVVASCTACNKQQGDKTGKDTETVDTPRKLTMAERESIAQFVEKVFNESMALCTDYAKEHDITDPEELQAMKTKLMSEMTMKLLSENTMDNDLMGAMTVRHVDFERMGQIGADMQDIIRSGKNTDEVEQALNAYIDAICEEVAVEDGAAIYVAFGYITSAANRYWSK